MKRKAEVVPIFRLPSQVLHPGHFLSEYSNRKTAEFRQAFAVWLVERAQVRPFTLLLIPEPSSARKNLILRLQKLPPASQVQHLNDLLKKTGPHSRARRALQKLGEVQIKGGTKSKTPSFRGVRLTDEPLTEVPLEEVQKAYERSFPPASKKALKRTRDEECSKDLISRALKHSFKLRRLADSASQLQLIVDSLLAIDSACHTRTAEEQVVSTLDSAKRMLMVIDQRLPGFLRKYLPRILTFETYRHFTRCGARENHPRESSQFDPSVKSEETEFYRRLRDVLFGDDIGWVSSGSSYRQQLASALLAVHAVDSGALLKFLGDLLARWRKIYAPGSTWRRNHLWGRTWKTACQGDRGKMDGVSEKVLKLSGKENVTVTHGETESRRRSRDLKMVSAEGFKKTPKRRTPAA